MKSYRFISMLLSFTLLVGSLSLFAGARGAFAQVTRVAIVKEMKGTVKIKKSGGSKSFNAFKNMSLNEGDSLTTGSGAKVVLELADSKADKDSMTVGANSQISFTKLEADSGTKAKMNVWAGSLWVKVKSISNADDTFEIETPTAIMGVRGTQFYTSVDPETGLTNVFVAAGVVAADTNPADGNDASNGGNPDNVPVVYPAQTIVVADSGSGGNDSSVAAVDMDQLTQQASPDIIEAIIKDSASIQEENKALMEKWQKEAQAGNPAGPLPPAGDPADLDRISQNFDNLIGNLAKKAVEEGKVSKEKMNELIEQVNAGSDVKVVDLDKVKPLEYSPAEQAKLDAQKKLQAEAQQRAQAENQKRDELQKQQAALIEKIKQQVEALAKENARAALEAKQKAEQALLSTLTEEQKKAFEQNKSTNVSNSQTPTAPTTSSPSNSGGSQTVSKPAVTLAVDKTSLTDPRYMDPILLAVKFSNFGTAKKVYGYQLKIEYNMDDFYFDEAAFNSSDKSYRTGSVFHVEPEGMNVPDATSVDYYKNSYITADSKNTGYLSYVVAAFTGEGVTLSGENTILTVPFAVHHPAAGTRTDAFKIVEVLAVDQNGAVIASYSAADTTKMTATNASVALSLSQDIIPG